MDRAQPQDHTMNSRPNGRPFFFNPGPTNIPDRILNAMNKPTLDFLSPEFLEIHTRVHEGMKKVLKTKQHMFIYAANGHGAWEAALVNVLAPGAKVLSIESGHFSANWSQMATELGYHVETVAADWRLGAGMDAVAARLKADTNHEIKAVLAVHNETATGVVTPVADVRAAMDQVKHPALLMADTISSLGSFDFQMDGWGVDIVVGGSQKGLMMTTGLSFTGVSEKALDLSKSVKTPRSYWGWADMLTRQPQKFPGTTPVHMFFGLDEAIHMIEAEGLDAIFRRHRRYANAARAAVAHWGDGAKSGVTVSSAGIKGGVKAIELLCADPKRASDSVSAVVLPDGFDANAMRSIAGQRFNVSLGGGLGNLNGRVFRIGHLGDLNEPMVLGALATCELALKTAKIPHKSGGVDAAMRTLLDG
jgi:alanine-glyoxylate transaminase / serine-glyoxylate transaminase / serine-pyruvate transaminase